MNTTLTRMVYDRLTRQQQLSIAVAYTKEDVAVDRRIAGEKPAHPIGIHVIKSIKGLIQSVVALFTRSAVRRGVWP